MEADSTVVIKVTYGDSMRRFNVRIVEGELDLNIDGLREKILSLFSFAPDSELILTYADEDGDVVNLVDADDLRDMVKQGLNPLRITVKLSSEKISRQSSDSSGSSTPLRSPRVQQPLQNLNAGVSEILKTMPGPLRETLVKLSTDLTSRASSSAPGIAEIVDYFSKVGLSYLNQLCESQTRMSPSTNSDPKSSQAQTENKDSDPLKVNTPIQKVPSTGMEEQASKSNESLTKFQPEAAMGIDKLKLKNVTGMKMEASSKSRRLKAVSLAPGSRNDSVGKKEKVKKISGCYSKEKSHSTFSPLPNLVCQNMVLEEKLGGSSFKSLNTSYVGDNVPNAEPHAGSKTAYISALDPMKLSAPSAPYECSVPGMSNGNNLAVPLIPTSQVAQFRSGSSQNDGTGTISHLGVRCDGCGIHPITGPRFMSKLKADYDLCSTCFSEMGNGSDYIRMDRSAIYRNDHGLKGFYNSRQPPTLPEVLSRFSKLKSGPTKLDSHFIEDVTVFDGTVMAPLTPFTKIWRLRNNGKDAWPKKTKLVWIAGERLRNELYVELEIPEAGLPVGQELDVAVDFIAPEWPAHYVSYWGMVSPSGQRFGQCVWVLIQVDASLKETLQGTVRGLNLNFPPVSSCFIGPEIINSDLVPIVKDHLPRPDNSDKPMELLEPINSQEMKFPINDSLFVGSCAPSSAFAGSSSQCYPSQMSDPQFPSESIASVIEAALEGSEKKDDSGASTFVHWASLPVPHLTTNYVRDIPIPPAPIFSSHESAMELPRRKEVEEKLLRELEEMGFKQKDLNKEILRMNEYNLVQAVDNLCDICYSDSFLEE